MNTITQDQHIGEIIDFDQPPRFNPFHYASEGYQVLGRIKGKRPFDPKRIYIEPIAGRWQIVRQPEYHRWCHKGACGLQLFEFLSDRNIVPESWKGKNIWFYGSIFHCPQPHAYYVHWDEEERVWYYWATGRMYHDENDMLVIWRTWDCQGNPDC